MLAIPHIKDADRLFWHRWQWTEGKWTWGGMSQPQRDRSKRVDVRAKEVEWENVCELINWSGKITGEK